MKNKKIGSLEVTIIIILTFCLLIYELGFCNWNALASKTYNFSMFRIVVYIILMVLYKIFSKKFIEEAEKVIKYKKKIIIVYSIIATIFTIYELFSHKNTYSIILMILVELNGLLFILCVTKDYIKNIVLSIITCGFLFSITTTVYHIVDEKRHFLSALNVADGNLDFYNNGVTDRVFNEIEFNNPSINLAMDYFGEKYVEDKYKIPDNEEIYSTPTDTSPLLYIPSAIGINCARLLNGSVADIFIAGRVSNVICYGILLIIIFKLLKFKQDIFYCSYLMPITIILGASYSIDSLTIGIIGIFIAYVLKLSKENIGVIKFKQFIILLCLCFLCLLCKNGAYFGICLLIFLLPIIKSIKKDKKILFTIIIIILLALGFGLYEGIKIINSSQGDIRVEGSSPIKQIEFILENPKNLLTVYANYLRSSILNLNWYTGFNLKVFCGQYYSIVSFMLFIFILYKAITDNTYTFSKKERIIMFSTFIITFLLTTFAFYLLVTPERALSINGYQARYLIAILPLILININSKKISKDYVDTNQYNKTALYIGIFTIFDLLSKIGI